MKVRKSKGRVALITKEQAYLAVEQTTGITRDERTPLRVVTLRIPPLKAQVDWARRQHRGRITLMALEAFEKHIKSEISKLRRAVRKHV